MQTQWRVIAGPPGSGKTSVINQLSTIGHAVRPEGATLYIESQLRKGRLIEDICAFHNQPTLQREIARTNHELEEAIAHETHVPYVLDRCVVEVLAYCRLYEHGDEGVRPYIRRRFHPKVLLLDRLPFQPNHVRCENDEVAAKLDVLIEQVYRDEGYEVVRIPVPVHPDLDTPKPLRIAWSVEERVKLILNHWQQ